MCKKHPYYKKLDAKLALASTHRSQKSKREECRIYWCRKCRAHHLTSEAKR